MNTEVPAGYRAVPVLAWVAVSLGIAFPVAAALVLAAYPHSTAALCGASRPALYPMPPLAVGLVWPGVACALIVVDTGLLRYGRSVMDSTRTLGWGALGLFGLVLFVANGIMVFTVYHGGLATVVHCG